MSNGSLEADSFCCLIDEGVRCQNLAITATWSKRANKNVGAKLNLVTDPVVSGQALTTAVGNLYSATFCSSSQAGHKYICEYHNSVVYQMKAKRRRKESDDDSDPSSSDVSRPLPVLHVSASFCREAVILPCAPNCTG